MVFHFNRIMDDKQHARRIRGLYRIIILICAVIVISVVLAIYFFAAP